MPFTQIIKFTVAENAVESFQSALLVQHTHTQAEQGSVATRFYQDNSNPSVFFAYERWENVSAVKFHQEQSYTQHFMTVAKSALLLEPVVITLEDTNPSPMAPISAAEDDPRFNIFFIFKIKPGTKEKLLEQFKHHITNTRNEAGCLLFDLYTVEGDDETLVVYEHWRKESDVWDIHFKQPYAIETGELMAECVIGELDQYMSFVTQFA
ncbi:antibiotic biosynthesis monooxygenase [Vibrio tapetis subsp. quintayensis]|uniref:putative quinol monooxygenase n=1 Tax=Vibrio tapetis TaxID=52443 RepID=UPI0025B49A13|nr:antibiotic biosynthesis monooxygenase [Vibrio tapetis]MDN3682789.1 antibiotic biosynthesis monooxygenase [Vibrio tapetis subsp. quintayensis]